MTTHLTTLLLVTRLCTPAYGQSLVLPRICDSERPDRCSVYIEAGQMAPYDGHLVSTELAIALSQQASGCKDRINLEVNHAQQEAQLSLSSMQHLRDLEMQRADALQAKLDNAPWYQHPVVFAVLLTGCVVGTAFAVKRL